MLYPLSVTKVSFLLAGLLTSPYFKILTKHGTQDNMLLVRSLQTRCHFIQSSSSYGLKKVYAFRTASYRLSKVDETWFRSPLVTYYLLPRTVYVILLAAVSYRSFDVELFKQPKFTTAKPLFSVWNNECG